MLMKIKRNDYFCKLKEFEINGIEADISNFGKFNEEFAEKEERSCIDRQFVPMSFGMTAKLKYNINAEDYLVVCAALKELLSFGNCSNCDC